MAQTKQKLLWASIFSIGIVGWANIAQAQPTQVSPVPTLAPPQAYLPTSTPTTRIELSLSQRRVTLYQGDQMLKSYPVAVGMPGWETPVGTFEIRTMYENPAWRHPFEGYVVPSKDPKNPLGSRWMGFWKDDNGWAGFHGTADFMRPSIGTAASHGCVRLYDEDAIEMYSLVSVGTPVIIKP
jgi:lipoprotein-anchoring transpeptidase ErfK/SrfK